MIVMQLYFYWENNKFKLSCMSTILHITYQYIHFLSKIYISGLTVNFRLRTAMQALFLYIFVWFFFFAVHVLIFVWWMDASYPLLFNCLLIHIFNNHFILISVINIRGDYRVILLILQLPLWFLICFCNHWKIDTLELFLSYLSIIDRQTDKHLYKHTSCWLNCSLTFDTLCPSASCFSMDSSENNNQVRTFSRSSW